MSFKMMKTVERMLNIVKSVEITYLLAVPGERHPDRGQPSLPVPRLHAGHEPPLLPRPEPARHPRPHGDQQDERRPLAPRGQRGVPVSEQQIPGTKVRFQSFSSC